MDIVKMYGPPGTGKTSALLEILDKELEKGIDPERVAFMSFTVAARREAVSRVMDRFGFGRSRLPHFRTIHSAAFAQMGVPRTAIVTADKIDHFSQVANVEFSPAARGMADTDQMIMSMMSSKVEGDRMLAYDHLRRHRCQSLEESYRGWEDRPMLLQHFVLHYTRWKAREGLYDFTDLLAHAEQPLDVEVVFIDEAQDLSRLQWQAVWRLCVHAKRVYIAGDDDQAIFDWAGADPRVFVNLAAKDTRVLGQSWRVPPAVHRIADVVVHGINDRAPKEWRPRTGDYGSAHYETDVKWWDPNDDGTTFVLARNKYLLLRYEDKLRRLGIPYHRSDKKTWAAERWIDAVMAWEKQRRGKDLDVSQREAIKTAIMPGTVIDPSVPWFDALNRIPERESLYMRAILERYGNSGLLDPPRFLLSTIHGVKGREADHVVMDSGMSRVVKKKIFDDSEHRVAYVGITRAMKSYTLVGGQHPLIPMNVFGKERQHAG